MTNGRWINACEREPLSGEVHVIQVDVDNTINRTKARFVDGKWILCGANSRPLWRVVAWLEATSPLSKAEASKVPLENIRF
jgi:hypothetical protein